MLEDWFRKASQCGATSSPALRNIFNSADYVDGFVDELTIFDVGGNQYRIALAIHYDKQRIYVRSVMSAPL